MRVIAPPPICRPSKICCPSKTYRNSGMIKGLSSKPMTAAKLSSSPSSHSAQVPATGLDKHRKTASITIRLSNAECAQLHQRAAEAGLTISAYLRSCICEVEALRAQVKEALAQLRPVTAKDEQKPACTKSAVKHAVWARLHYAGRAEMKPAFSDPNLKFAYKYAVILSCQK